MKKVIFISSLLFIFSCKEKEAPKPKSEEKPLSEKIIGDWKIIKSQSERHLTIYPQPECQTNESINCTVNLSIDGEKITKTNLYYTYNDVVTNPYTLNADSLVSKSLPKEVTVSFKADTMVLKIPNTIHIGDDNIIRYVDSYSYYVKR